MPIRREVGLDPDPAVRRLSDRLKFFRDGNFGGERNKLGYT